MSIKVSLSRFDLHCNVVEGGYRLSEDSRCFVLGGEMQAMRSLFAQYATTKAR